MKLFIMLFILFFSNTVQAQLTPFYSTDTGKFGFIDKTGRQVVPPLYEEANNYHGGCCYKGMADVKENGKLLPCNQF